ncbi:hypothetical protein HOG98_08995 [bacterium]|nr:hypothetical protein [bacterium]
MSFGSPIETSKKNSGRFQNFIVFEQSSSRISETDVYLRGEQIVPFFNDLYQKIQQKETLKTQILINKFAKIQQMLSLVNNMDNIIVTKFFDRIWKRYGYVSNLGESFTDFETYKTYKEDALLNIEDLIATRVDAMAALKKEANAAAAAENANNNRESNEEEDDEDNDSDNETQDPSVVLEEESDEEELSDSEE